VNDTKQAISSEFAMAGDFFSSIISGFLLGFAGDHFLGTRPWLVVSGIVAGSVTGFYRMYRNSEFMVRREE
jgi:F0F1-type ATP synthase assembly protein I